MAAPAPLQARSPSAPAFRAGSLSPPIEADRQRTAARFIEPAMMLPVRLAYGLCRGPANRPARRGRERVTFGPFLATTSGGSTPPRPIV